MQWPGSAKSRRQLANYLVVELKLDPIVHICNAASSRDGSHPVIASNGMITFGNPDHQILFPLALLDDQHRLPATVSEGQLKSVVLHCLCRVLPLNVVAAFVRSKHEMHSSSVLFAHLWADMAYLHVPPRIVAAALWCQRPDMQLSIHRLYGGWLEWCRNPSVIDEALCFLCESSWHVESSSHAFSILAELMIAGQIAAVASPSVKVADIIVDNRAGLLLSKRDKAFMALALAVGPQHEAIKKGIPAFSDVRDMYPKAFCELPQGSHALDEIPIKKCDE